MGSKKARILLTADWRLHEVCEGIVRASRGSTVRLANAPRDAVRHVIDFAIQEEVNVLVNAGNTLTPELACPSDYTFLYGELDRLADANIDVIWNWSPLDQPYHWPRCFKFPSNVQLFNSSTPQILEVPLAESGSINFVGLAPSASDSVLAEWFDGIELDGITFGVSHSLPKGEGPGFDGWLVAGKSYSFLRNEGGSALISSGSPQSRCPSQIGPHGAVLLDVTSADEYDLQFMDTSALQYHKLQVDIHDYNTDALLESILEHLANIAFDENILNAIEVELLTDLPTAHAMPLTDAGTALAESVQSIFTEISSSLYLVGISSKGDAKFGTAEHEEIIGEFLFAVNQMKESGWEQLNLSQYLPHGRFSELSVLTEDLQGLDIINQAASLAVSLFDRTDQEAA